MPLMELINSDFKFAIHRPETISRLRHFSALGIAPRSDRTRNRRRPRRPRLNVTPLTKIVCRVRFVYLILELD
jgi:hypothetical protein